MLKLVCKEQPECIQMKHYLHEINALNKNKDKNIYIIPYYRINIRKLFLNNQEICFWNTEVPGQIKNVANVTLLSKQLKDYMFQRHRSCYSWKWPYF